jgi:hypothetical protein
VCLYAAFIDIQKSFTFSKIHIDDVRMWMAHAMDEDGKQQKRDPRRERCEPLSAEYRKGVIPARPLYQGVRGSVWDPEPSKERVGDWGGPDGLGSLVCCRQGVPQGQPESGGIVLAVICWSPCAQRRCYPTGRCAYRPPSLLD